MWYVYGEFVSGIGMPIVCGVGVEYVFVSGVGVCLYVFWVCIYMFCVNICNVCMYIFI